MVNRGIYVTTINSRVKGGINFTVRSGRKAGKADLSSRKAHPVDASYDKGSTFPLECFLSSGTPYPKSSQCQSCFEK